MSQQLALVFARPSLTALLATPSKADWKNLTRAEQWALVAENGRRSRAKLAELVKRGALVVVSHSGGKDSQALLAFVRRHVPDSQIVIVHATLGRYEWAGVIEHIKATSDGLPLYIAEAIFRDGTTKTFGSMVLRRGMYPDVERRQCTSDLKRGPIEKVIRRIARERGVSLIVELTGVRAEESAPRRRRCVQSWSFDSKNSKAGRRWYKLDPIADWTIEQVWSEIADAGQERHWAYDAGMSRLSCSFCIMANKSDQRIAAELRPDLYAEMVAMEKHIDHTMSMDRKPLEEVTGIAADAGKVRRHLAMFQQSSQGAA